MENIIQLTEELDCGVKQAFKMFTVSELLEKWLTEKAEVEPVLGGKYELFWVPEDRNSNSTIGCRITGLEEDRFVSFDWKGPAEFESFMNSADPLTHIIVFFSPANDGPGRSTVHLFHTGWRKGSDWQKAREYFEKAWTIGLQELKKQTSD
ncbi:MAG: SRPBCC domain-containing protein [Candidatus Odinarchaeota archaeon]